MAQFRIVTVGSEARKLGKTSLACSLISRFSERRWCAVKVTPHTHGAAAGLHIHQEFVQGPSDTGRFLAAGAAESFLVQAEASEVAQAISDVRGRIASDRLLVIESTAAMITCPDALRLLFLAPSERRCEVKPYAADARQRAHAFIGTTTPAFATQVQPFLAVEPPDYCSPNLLEFVRSRLSLG